MGKTDSSDKTTILTRLTILSGLIGLAKLKKQF